MMFQRATRCQTDGVIDLYTKGSIRLCVFACVRVCLLIFKGTQNERIKPDLNSFPSYEHISSWDNMKSSTL